MKNTFQDFFVQFYSVLAIVCGTGNTSTSTNIAMKIYFNWLLIRQKWASSFLERLGTIFQYDLNLLLDMY